MDLTCGHFVNPFTDIGFKIIFGQPASKELLITLLNELLSGEHRIAYSGGYPFSISGDIRSVPS